jgi:hypothetical protein
MILDTDIPIDFSGRRIMTKSNYPDTSPVQGATDVLYDILGV